jgi:hypothetical protein
MEGIMLHPLPLAARKNDGIGRRRGKTRNEARVKGGKEVLAKRKGLEMCDKTTFF